MFSIKNRRLFTAILSMIMVISIFSIFSISASATIVDVAAYRDVQFTTRSYPEPVDLEIDTDVISMVARCQGDEIDTVTCYVIDLNDPTNNTIDITALVNDTMKLADLVNDTMELTDSENDTMELADSENDTMELANLTYASDFFPFTADGSVTTFNRGFPAGLYKVFFIGNNSDILKEEATVLFSAER